MADGDGEWSLTKTFKKAATWALKVATIGVAAAVCWQMFMDPLFFLPIHDPTNLTMQSWVAFMNDHFGWIPDMVGATGDGGLLNSDFAQSFLGEYRGISPQEMAANYAAPAVDPTGGMNSDTLSGWSLDDL